MDTKKIKKAARRIVKTARQNRAVSISLREVVASDRGNYAELIAEVMKLACKTPALQLVA